MQSIKHYPGSDPIESLTRRLGVLAMVSMAVTVIVMDGSIVNVALPTLAKTLEGSSNSQLQWVVDSYILAFAALLLTSGNAADRWGRRRLLCTGLTVFGAMSLGAATADTAHELIVWRSLMGVGAAMIFPATLAILTDAFPDRAERSKAIAVWAGSSGVGVAIGPVAGGWLLEHYAWGSIFLINIPIVAIAIVGSLLLVNVSRDENPERFDPVGNVLAVCWIVALVFGLIEGPVLGWSSPIIAMSLAGAVLMAAGFIWWELRTDHPMLDVRFFADRAFSSACFAIAAAFFGLFGFVFMVTQYFQFVHQCDPLAAGLRTLPFAGFILLGAWLAARFAHPSRRAGLSSIGLMLMAIGFAWVTVDTVDTTYLTLVWQMGLLGSGLGLVNASATEAIMDSLPAGRTGIGSSVNDTTRELGGTLGVAAMGSLFNSVYRDEIMSSFADSPLPAEAVSAIQESVGAAAQVVEQVGTMAGASASDLTRAPIVQAFLDGFHASSVLACVSAAAGSVGVLLLAPRPRSLSLHCWSTRLTDFALEQDHER